MKRSINLGSVLVALALTLAGCSQVAETYDASTVNCDQVASALAQAKTDAERSAGTPGKAKADAKVVAIEARQKVCASGGGSPTPTATRSASETPTPTSTANTQPMYIGWDQLVASPPAGLAKAINNQAKRLSFNWADAHKWASQKSPKGHFWDARVILVFQGDLSASDARRQAGVPDGIPVVRVDQCTALVGNGCLSSGVEVILAPLGTDGALNASSGVAVSNDGTSFSLVAGITGQQLK